MKEIISKELLSAVFGQEVTKIKAIETKWDMQVLPFWSNEKHFYIAIEVIASKCKELAFKQDKRYLISSSITEGGKYHAEVSIFENGLGHIFKFGTSSLVCEAEATIKACQWILDNKDKQ